jgi:hypothetical protein
MMAEMIANYTSQGKSPAAATTAPVQASPSPAVVPPQDPNGGDYLNEVRSVSAAPRPH